MAGAIHVASGLRFLVQIKRIRRGSLHPIRGLHRLDATLQRVIDAAARGEVLVVEIVHEVEQAALICVLQSRIVQPRNHLLRIEV